MALAGTSVLAASGDEFYDRQFNRGLTQFNEGNYAGAYTSLKVAAFGLLEDIRRFEIAEVYMTVSAVRMHREAEARIAAQRVVAAERIERRYALLLLPDAVRKEFDAAARKLLTADQVAMLQSAGAPRPQPQPQQVLPPQPPPRKTDPPPVIVPAPQPTPRPSPVPRVETPAPQPKPVQPKPVQPQPVQPQPVQPQPQPVRPQPVPQPPVVLQQPTARPSSDTLGDADRAVNGGDLATARTLYRAALEAPQLSHATALRIAEGLYRSRDFAGAIRAFQKAGAIGTGQEQYHYYYAVALYENGRYGEAKRELRAALPFIEVTPDVERVRVKIEGAIE